MRRNTDPDHFDQGLRVTMENKTFVIIPRVMVQHIILANRRISLCVGSVLAVMVFAWYRISLRLEMMYCDCDFVIILKLCAAYISVLNGPTKLCFGSVSAVCVMFLSCIGSVFPSDMYLGLYCCISITKYHSIESSWL